MSAHVTLLPSGKVVECNSNEDLLTQLKANGYAIKSNCGGCASCGTCTVKVISGDENLNDFSFEEKQLLGNVFHITKERLACQTKVTGNVTIDISEHEEAAAPSKPKTAKVRKKDEVDAMYEERNLKRQEKNKKRDEKEGGFRRPKAFKTEDK